MSLVLYCPYDAMRLCLRTHLFRADLITQRERMLRIHLVGSFTSLVMTKCYELNTTPWSDDGVQVPLDLLMREAEYDLPIDPPDEGDYEAIYLVRQRRQYAYSMFLRLTSQVVTS